MHTRKLSIILQSVSKTQIVDMVIKLCCYDHDKYGKHMQIYRGENNVFKFMRKMVEEVDIVIARKQQRNISTNH